MDSDDVAAIERLIAKDEIIDLVHRYSYCVDHRLTTRLSNSSLRTVWSTTDREFRPCDPGRVSAACSNIPIVALPQRATTMRTFS
jgi:hypothetical protein